MPDIYARTLRLAAHIVGGVNELAARLSVPADALALWLTSREPVPLEILLRAVDVVVSHGLEQIGSEPTIEIPSPTAAASHDVEEPSDERTLELVPLKQETEPKKPALDGEDEPTIEIAPPKKR
jgi:hypothetical protein